MDFLGFFSVSMMPFYEVGDIETELLYHERQDMLKEARLISFLVSGNTDVIEECAGEWWSKVE